MAISNLGRWASTYEFGLEDAQPYGDTQTYGIGAEWLADCQTVEDWGCGKGYFSNYIEPERYWGLDGSETPWADGIVDLADYQSRPDGIFMRHVLEHDKRWREVLANAAASFQERFALVLFTPMAEVTEQIAWNDKQGVPDYSFSETDITHYFERMNWTRLDIESATQYGAETVFLVEK